MDAFMADAKELFESAQAGSDPADIAIVVGPTGGIRIVEAAGWALSSLHTEMGAQRVYRIRRDAGGVQLDGWSHTSRCSLKSEEPAAIARRLLSSRTALPGQSYLLAQGATEIASQPNPYLLLNQ